MRSFLVATSCLLIIYGTVSADFVGYDPISRNEMPGTGWVLDPTYLLGENPIRRQVPPGSGTVVSADGIAHIDTDNTATSRWIYSGIGFDSSTGFTVDFRVSDLLGSTINTGCAFRIGEENHFFMIIKVLGAVGVDPNVSRLQIIWSTGPDSYSTSIADSADGFHTYRVAVLNESYSFYVDDQKTPILSGTLVSGSSTSNVAFGDMGSSTNGNADLDYVLWDSSQAIFAPPIPEPATVSLILCGLSVYMLKRKRS